MKATTLTKPKEPVKIRFKELRNGNKSVYLDIYQNGQRTKEFLRMYLIPERTHADKMQNEETIRTAQTIKAQRVIMMQNEAHGFSNSSTKGKRSLFDFLNAIAERHEAAGRHKRAQAYRITADHLRRYRGERITLKQVDKAYLTGFLDYLTGGVCVANGKEGKGLARSAQLHYFRTLVSALNIAVKEDYITSNPANKVEAADKPRPDQRTREYLTLEEVRRLASVECKGQPEVKTAFLFACFTGLRWSDVVGLRWSDIVNAPDGKKQIQTIQEKTGSPVYIPLSDNAQQYLPKRGKKGASERVFVLPSYVIALKWLMRWVTDAGITKRVTFHIARHTFATLTLTYGADIYTVSKLLGHTNIQTTQIYAKIVDENKRKAVELIPRL